MKLPTYITKEQKLKMLQMFHYVKEKEGLKQANVLKRLITVGTYGIMILGKIDLYTFLSFLERHILIRKEPIHTFWYIKYKADHLKNREKIFLIPAKIIYYGTNAELEKEISNFYSNIARTTNSMLLSNMIKKEYLQEFQQMFK